MYSNRDKQSQSPGTQTAQSATPPPKTRKVKPPKNPAKAKIPLGSIFPPSPITDDPAFSPYFPWGGTGEQQPQAGPPAAQMNSNQQGQVPVPQGQVPVPQGQVPVPQGQVPVQQGQASTGIKVPTPPQDPDSIYVKGYTPQFKDYEKMGDLVSPASVPTRDTGAEASHSENAMKAALLVPALSALLGLNSTNASLQTPGYVASALNGADQRNEGDWKSQTQAYKASQDFIDKRNENTVNQYNATTSAIREHNNNERDRAIRADAEAAAKQRAAQFAINQDRLKDNAAKNQSRYVLAARATFIKQLATMKPQEQLNELQTPFAQSLGIEMMKDEAGNFLPYTNAYAEAARIRADAADRSAKLQPYATVLKGLFTQLNNGSLNGENKNKAYGTIKEIANTIGVDMGSMLKDPIFADMTEQQKQRLALDTKNINSQIDYRKESIEVRKSERNLKWQKFNNETQGLFSNKSDTPKYLLSLNKQYYKAVANAKIEDSPDMIQAGMEKSDPASQTQRLAKKAAYESSANDLLAEISRVKGVLANKGIPSGSVNNGSQNATPSRSITSRISGKKYPVIVGK